MFGEQGLNIARLRSLMAHLRADITELLFLNAGVDDSKLERRTCGPKTFQALDRMSDIEALTACLGLSSEAEYLNNEYQHFLSAVTAFRIFLRLSISHPLSETAPAILDYLNPRFFSAAYDHIPRRGPGANGVDLHLETSIRTSIVLILEDFGVLSPDRSKKRACLYLADVYGLGAAACELEGLYRTMDWRQAKSAPIVRWFARRLRSCELTASCLD
jgi:hypothetical protein